MNAPDQVRLLHRLEKSLDEAHHAASRLPSNRPFLDRINSLRAFASRWRDDLESLLPEAAEVVCFGRDARLPARTIDRDEEIV